MPKYQLTALLRFVLSFVHLKFYLHYSMPCKYQKRSAGNIILSMRQIHDNELHKAVIARSGSSVNRLAIWSSLSGFLNSFHRLDRPVKHSNQLVVASIDLMRLSHFIFKIIMIVKLLLPLATALLFVLTRALTTVPTFLVSNKYCQAGTYSLDTTPYYGNISANAFEGFNFNIPLLKSHSSYKAVSSISTLNYLFTAQREVNVTAFICTFGTNSLEMCLTSMKTSSLSVLAVRYLILDDPYSSKMTHMYSSAYFYTQNQGTTPLSSVSPINTGFNLPAINTIGTLKAIVAINGLNATATDATLTIDIKIQASYASSTAFTIAITSGSTTVLNVGSVVFCIIGFNVQDAMAWPFPAARITTASFKTNAPFADTGNLFRNYNSFWGTIYLQTSNQATLTFDSYLLQNASITGQSTIQSSDWVGVIFEMKECDPTTPYYMTSQDKCYDICPNLYYEDSASKLCQKCTAYDCLKCVSNATCTSCDSTTRIINSSTLRCDPLPGYYDSGLFAAAICDSNCKTCTAASTTCASCHTQKYLSGSTCLPCISNCDSCTNGAACVQCAVGYSYLAQPACSSVCGDGVLSPSEECDLGSNLAADGCVNCKKEKGHYCTGAIGGLSVCTQCTKNCMSCDNATVCLQCDFNFTLSANSAACEAANSISPPQPSGINLLYILLPLLFGLLLCCCCIIFCIWRRRKNDDNKVQEEKEGEAQIIEQNIKQNSNKLNQTTKVQDPNESKEIFEQKTLNKKKSKYRSDQTKSSLKPKSRRNLVREQTEENVVSLQEFKGTLQLNKQKKNNKPQSVEKVTDAHLHILPILPQNDIQDFQPEFKIEPQAENIPENAETADLGQKSQIYNQDMVQNRIREQFSDSNETKQLDSQDEQRGR